MPRFWVKEVSSNAHNGRAQHSKRTKCCDNHSPSKSTVHKGYNFPCSTIITQIARHRISIPQEVCPAQTLVRCRPLCGRAHLPPMPSVRSAVVLVKGGGGVGMMPWYIVLVCSWRHLLADDHTLPFPWTLSLHRRWCPSASHHPMTFLFLLALSFFLYFPFLSLGLSLHRPWCPSASHHSFPFLSLGRLCQQSPRTCPVSLLRVESMQRKATTFTVGQVVPLPNGGFWALGCPLAGSFPRQGHITTSYLQIPALSPPLSSASCTPYPLLYALAVCVVSPFPRVARTGMGCGGWCQLLGRGGWFLLGVVIVGPHVVVGVGWRGGCHWTEGRGWAGAPRGGGCCEV